MPEPDPASLSQATLEALHQRLDQVQIQLNDLNQSRTLFRGIGWLKLLLSALTAGMVGFFTPILAVAAVIEGPIPGTAWLIAGGGAAIALAKDVRSQLDLPPPAPNGVVPLPKGLKGGGS